jgi:hypothetical protein
MAKKPTVQDILDAKNINVDKIIDLNYLSKFSNALVFDNLLEITSLFSDFPNIENCQFDDKLNDIFQIEIKYETFYDSGEGYDGVAVLLYNNTPFAISTISYNDTFDSYIFNKEIFEFFIQSLIDNSIHNSIEPVDFCVVDLDTPIDFFNS